MPCSKKTSLPQSADRGEIISAQIRDMRDPSSVFEISPPPLKHCHRRGAIGTSLPKSYDSTAGGPSADEQIRCWVFGFETFARFETLETHATMVRAIACLFLQWATGVVPWPWLSSSICGDDAGRAVREPTTPHAESDMPLVGRGRCSASNGQNCHGTNAPPPAYLAAQEGHVAPPTREAWAQTGATSIPATQDPHNPSSLITVAIPFRTSTPRSHDEMGKQRGRRSHGQGDRAHSSSSPARMYPWIRAHGPL
jgi:hypothetical protein